MDAKSRLHALVEEVKQLDVKIELAEKSLSQMKSLRWDLRTRSIPDLMLEDGVRGVELDDGTKVSVTDDIEGAVPKDPERRHGVLAWLRANGHGGIIKNTVAASFGRGQDNLACAVRDDLVKQGLTVEQREEVHTQTYLAWAREQTRAGEVLPMDQLGLRPITIAKIKSMSKE